MRTPRSCGPTSNQNCWRAARALPVDVQRSVSRRHAQVVHKDAKFYVVEEIGTINGTFVNGLRVETGVPVELRPGDEVRFGLVDVVFEPS